MKRFHSNIIAVLLIALINSLVSCSGGKSVEESRGKGDSISSFSDSQGLDFPPVPLNITDEREEAGYTIVHFWDRMDFTDSLKIRDDRFMENSFKRYFSVFPYASAQDSETAVAILMHKARATEEAYVRVLEMAELFLSSPNSYMRDEETYYLFLKAADESDFQDPALKARIRERIADVMRNRKGTKAADFKIGIPEGGITSLYRETEKAGLTMLLFYDPECSHCHEILELIKEMRPLSDAVASGRLRVVAVYPYGDRKIWENSSGMLPVAWLDGFSPDGEVERREIYSLPAMPVIYLLSSDNTVLLKDASLPELEAFISEASGNR